MHHHLGPGFRELFYQRALALEFPAQGLEFSREVRIAVHYRGARLGHTRVDFIVEEVLVEIKAKAEIEAVDVVQTLSYLKAADAEVGLLLNFGAKSLQIKRLIHTLNR
ncbi:MAG: GxxExxY protein [Anaerolineales bacterium]